MENIQSNNLKIINKKMIVMSLIVLAATLIMGLIFVINTDCDFVVTRTIWDEVTEGVDSDTSGGGVLFIFAGLVSGLTFLGELTLLLVIVVAFLVIPVGVNAFILIINLIARVIQIGNSKKWKNIIAKILLYSSIVLQGILSIYILFLCFTGYGLVYVTIYLMFIINVYVVVKNILNNRNGKNISKSN